MPSVDLMTDVPSKHAFFCFLMYHKQELIFRILKTILILPPLPPPFVLKRQNMSDSFFASIPKFISKTYWFQFRFLKFSVTSGLKIQNFLLRSKNLMNDFSYGKRRQNRLVVAEPPERMAAKVASKNRIFPFFSGWVGGWW